MTIAQNHILECLAEEGRELPVPSCEQSYFTGQHEVEVWYDEASGSPFAWNAFIYGYGTRTGASELKAIQNALEYLF